MYYVNAKVNNVIVNKLKEHAKKKMIIPILYLVLYYLKKEKRSQFKTM